MKRRTFITSVSAFSACVAAGLFKFALSDDAWTQLVVAIARDLNGKTGASTIGQMYLDKHADERSSGRLVALILPDPIGKPTKEVAKLAISRRIDEDFKLRRTVKVHGWILSETEARLFALSAIA